MSEDYEHPEGQETFVFVRRYEEMLRKGETWFFDLHQIEGIVDYYFYRHADDVASEAIKFGYSIFPNSPHLQLRESQLMMNQGQLKKAQDNLLVLLELEPFNDEVHWSLGSIYSDLQNHDLSAYHYKLALEHCDSESRDEIVLDLIRELEFGKKEAEAIVLIKNAILESPHNDALIYELIYLHDSVGALEQAISFLHKFLDDYPYSSTGWFNLGQAYLLVAKAEKAIQALDYCLAIHEEFRPGQIAMGHALFASERFQEAIEFYLKSIDEEMPQPAVLCCLGECEVQLDHLQNAVSYFEKALVTKKDFVDAWVGLALVYDMLGEDVKALEHICTASNLDQENPEVTMVCGSMHMKSGQLKKALSYFERLTEQSPFSIDAWLHLTDCYVGLEETHLALQKIKEALSINPEHTDLQYRKVAYMYLLNKHTEALLLLRHLVTSAPDGLTDLLDYLPAFSEEKEVIQIFQSQGNHI